MPSINLAHERFISQMILHGHMKTAYLFAYPNCSESSSFAAASRLMKNRYIQFRIRDAVLATQHEVEEELKEHLMEKAMSMNDKRYLLALIARGQLTTTKTVVKYGKEFTWEVKPTHREMLAAIGRDMQLTKCRRREFDDSEF